MIRSCSECLCTNHHLLNTTLFTNAVCSEESRRNFLSLNLKTASYIVYEDFKRRRISQRQTGRMLWEEHSWGLLTAMAMSVVFFLFGLVVNFSSLALQYTAASFMPELLEEMMTRNGSHAYFMPVSLSDWSNSVWGVIYLCQFSWLVYALAGICRPTSAGPAYNNPKLLPVQVHILFSMAVVTQVGWLILMDKEYLAWATVLAVLSIGCSLLCLIQSYRAFNLVSTILQQEGRIFDMWAVRLLAHNSVAFFMTWMALHGVMTYTLTLTFGLSPQRNMTLTNGSLMELCCAAFLMFCYVVSDLTVFDKYSRFVVLPYVSFVLFHTAQLNKTWPDRNSAVFVLLAGLTAFTFLCVFLKVIVLLWRHLKGKQEQSPGVISIARPLTADLEEEETYLLNSR